MDCSRSTVFNEKKQNYLDIPMNMVVDPLRIRHIFDHHIADLKGSLPETNLQKLDRANLPRQLATIRFEIMS